MPEIPERLVQSIRSGDCILWSGAGLGALVGRPGWTALLERLIARCPADDRSQLQDLLEQGRLRPILGYVHRHLSWKAVEGLLNEVSREDRDETSAAVTALSSLGWRACFATVYADVLYNAFVDSGRSVDVIAHTDAHRLSLRGRRQPFILRTPPAGRSMRADTAFFELVEEVVRTRTLFFLGFDIDDPDLYQLFELLHRVGRGNTHYALMPYVTDAEAEDLLDSYGIEVIRLEADGDLGAAIEQLVRACDHVEPRPAQIEDRIALLDLMRMLKGIDVRADLGLDLALGLDPREVDAMLEPVGSGIEAVDPGTLLRIGVVKLAHGQCDAARRWFQLVISRGSGREYQHIARFNSALVAFAKGDNYTAVDGLTDAGKADHTLELVPPRFEIVEVLGGDGTRLKFSCRDRETGEHLDIEVATLPRPVGTAEQKRFYQQIQRLVAIEHPTVKKVRGGFADGRLFGIMSEPAPAFVLEDILAQERQMTVDRAFEMLGPLMEGLDVCHRNGVIHRNVTPMQILVTPEGPMLRGFGCAPIVSYQRPSVRRSTSGYAAPEILEGAEPSPASDVYGLAAIFYRCVTGITPKGGVPAMREADRDIDPRLDDLIRTALHPDPRKRPRPTALRTEIARILTTPSPTHDSVAEAHAPAPQASSSSGKIPLPEDPEDLEGWAWILEQKPTHVQARRAIERIERAARDAQEWDRVADVLLMRAEHVQAQRERANLLRELAEIFEQELQAPANAFETLQMLQDDLPVADQVELLEDLMRLGEVAGLWSELAESMEAVAERVSESSEKARLYHELGRIHAEQLGAHDRALVDYRRALELEPDDPSTLRAMVPICRQSERHAELASALLSLAELESDNARKSDLIEAVQMLDERLEDPEGAFAAAELLWVEYPDDEHVQHLVETLARRLHRWEVLAPVLVARADAASKPEALELRREAAELAADRLEQPELAITQWQIVLAEHGEDREGAERLVVLLRAVSAEDPSWRPTLVEALEGLATVVGSAEQQARLLAEAAETQQAEPGGSPRAAEYRQQVLALLPPEHPLAQSTAEILARHYRGHEDYEGLMILHRDRGKAGTLQLEQRVQAWAEVLALARGPLDDVDLTVESLRALTSLQPQNDQWRDELLALYLQREEFEQAGPLIRARVDAEDDPVIKADLLVQGASLREQIGKIEGAIEALEEATALAPSHGKAWSNLAALYERTGQPIKALEARVAAAETASNRLERTRTLMSAAKDSLEQLDRPERGLQLLERILQLDPDHRESAELLMQRLMDAGDLERAWPVAEAYVRQIRTQAPDDEALNLHALAAAARCAVAAGTAKEAREYLLRAREYDQQDDPEISRLLGDMEMETEAWSEAVAHYQSALASTTQRWSPAQQAQIHVRMAEAHKHLRDLEAAGADLDRALRLQPELEPAIRLLVEVAELQNRPVPRVQARHRLARLLEKRQRETVDSEAVSAIMSERAALLRKIADDQARSSNSQEDAVRTLEQVLELQPDAHDVLHRMLDLYTSMQRWQDATHILDRLAEGEREGAAKAKYLYAGAVILRDQLNAPRPAVEWFYRVLVADPDHDKAFEACRDVLEKLEDWSELSALLHERIRSRAENARPEELVPLLEQVGDLHERRLADAATAMAAFEQAIALTPAQIPHDADELVGRRRKVFGLALSLGDDQVDKAIRQAHALMIAKPMDFSTYHELRELYEQRGQIDPARCIARTLSFLKQANSREQALAAQDVAQLPQARGSITGEQWRKCLYHPLESPRISELFSLIWPMIAAKEGRTFRHFGVNRSQRIEVSLQSGVPLARFLAYACQVLDTAVPDFYIKAEEPGGLLVTALAELEGRVAKTVFPTVMAGSDALARQTEPAIAFRVGRGIARARPEHILTAVLPSTVNLRHAVFGAMLVTHPDVAVPEDSHDIAERHAGEIRRYLPPARLDQLEVINNRLVEMGPIDTRAWAKGVAFTVSRVGFVLSDDLETAARILTTEGEEGVGISAKERIKDLVAYSVSEPYFRLRRELGLSR